MRSKEIFVKNWTIDSLSNLYEDANWTDKVQSAVDRHIHILFEDVSTFKRSIAQLKDLDEAVAVIESSETFKRKWVSHFQNPPTKNVFCVSHLQRFSIQRTS